VQPELIADCVHCGFCLPTCPTYSLWREEMDSPRGRIHLMSALADGTVELTDTVVEHFDRCLGCMACVTSCPSGVQYDRLIESTRQYIERNHSRGARDRMMRSLIFGIFPHRRRLRAAMAFRKLPAPGPLHALRELAPPWIDAALPREHLPGDGPRVAVVTGCVQSVLFGSVNAATARVLAADGYDVHVPRAQGCCGALHAHAGRVTEGVVRARLLEESLSGFDAIATNAAGCGSHLKDHRGAHFFDVTELIASAPAPATRHPLALRIAFQDSCHLKHAQQIVAEPRNALRAIPGLELVEPGEQELCCGSAGIYNIVQPTAARELGDRKAARVVETSPDAYASGNPGCLVQVTAALRRARRPLPSFHPIELVDASIRGLSVDELLGPARR
jgi:glycolate oxidase iron-sulfur subunit